MTMKHFLFLLLPIFSWSQTQLEASLVEEYLTHDTWNITYNISPEGEMMEEKDPQKIRNNWVIFHKDGSYEVPDGISGKIKGKWHYDDSTKSIYFQEKGTRYRAVVDEIGSLALVLHYVDHGGFKIGLSHYIYIPQDLSAREINRILLSGKWNIISKRYEEFEDETPNEDLENTWYEFKSGNIYKKSEVIAGEIMITEGTWFIDDELQLNLDADEMSIYNVTGDISRMIFSSVSHGVRIIEFRKAKS